MGAEACACLKSQGQRLEAEKQLEILKMVDETRKETEEASSILGWIDADDNNPTPCIHPTAAVRFNDKEASDHNS